MSITRRRFSMCPVTESLLNSRPAKVVEIAKPPRLRGKVSLHHRGFAFVSSQTGDSYYVPANLTRTLLPGDEIEFALTEQGDAPGSEVSREVQFVLQVHRQESLLLGVVKRTGEQAVLIPDEPCQVTLNLSLKDVERHQVESGCVVAVRIPAYKGRPVIRQLDVEIAQVLGFDRAENGFIQQYALTKHGFHRPMPEALHTEAASLKDEPVLSERITAMQSIPFVTIDGESTKDFDDAVYARRMTDGWEVRVAISDVSWYVKPGSALDQWASQQCTTVYLPFRTTPMLPDALSTGLCSLTPGSDKRAVVLTLRLDESGSVLSSCFERAWIRSAARLTYTDMAGFMAGTAIPGLAHSVQDSLSELNAVYKLLARLHETRGKLEFDDREPVIRSSGTDDWSLSWDERTEAHKLVEELMLLANRTVAEMLMSRYGAGLFRYQPPPEQADWLELRSWADGALPDAPDMKAMANLVADQPDENRQMAAALKVRACMQPAKYAMGGAAGNGGHFSLGMNWYTHFTSPIRRYPDLLVHRLLLAPASYELNSTEQSRLEQLVARCSERAQAARMAERYVWDSLKLKTFLAEVPQSTPVAASVVRATPRGLRVVLKAYQSGAWLPAAALKAQGYRFENNSWVAKDESLPVVTDGYTIPVCWTQVVNDRPAYPELLVALAGGRGGVR